MNRFEDLSHWKSNLNTLWGAAIIHELYHLGVDAFFLSSGYRSTPLVVPLAYDFAEDIMRVPAIDERACAYMALGYAKSTGRAAACICTSGTALANFFPAVIEAFHARVPMVILSADRPAELIDCDANQAIDQQKIFSNFTKANLTLPAPDEKIALASILTKIDYAVRAARVAPMGPVHINVPFREPLLPTLPPPASAHAPLIKRQRESYTKIIVTKKVLEKSELQLPAGPILVAVGELSLQEDLQAIKQALPLHLGSVYLDVTSSLRFLRTPSVAVANTLFDFNEATPIPSAILHLGGRILSKNYYTYLKEVQQNHPIPIIHVNDTITNQDSSAVFTHKYEISPTLFCKNLRLQERAALSEQSPTIVQKRDFLVDTVLEVIPDESYLYLGNSLTVRLFNRSMPESSTKSVYITCNRGVSGIEGLMASACGFARGLSCKRVTTLILGDLSFIYDLNSLYLLRDLPHPLVIVVINNGGGEIFKELPIANYPKALERFVVLKHDYRFKEMIEAAKLQYFASPLGLKKSLQEAYAYSMAHNKVAIVEWCG
ncbi:MAG: 2-succinyl-5-enolpyruvyl-6-hydroxy-3-cyclohexene-1-carboxylic-acid synthase [Oligoflexia bacterium]|nr:2-succinyl-5-enolpyruvyl-6-hydroxy-3-cyclohexene-1-carboxylic-acid synthase [Oligoflexia bacterium]